MSDMTELTTPVACRWVDNTGDYVYSTIVYQDAEPLYMMPGLADRTVRDVAQELKRFAGQTPMKTNAKALISVYELDALANRLLAATQTANAVQCDRDAVIEMCAAELMDFYHRSSTRNISDFAAAIRALKTAKADTCHPAC